MTTGNIIKTLKKYSKSPSGSKKLQNDIAMIEQTQRWLNEDKLDPRTIAKLKKML